MMKRGKMHRKKVSYDYKHFRKKFIYKILLTISIILFLIALVYLLFFVLEKVLNVEKEAGLKGELPSFGIFGEWQETEFVRANCSDENLKAIWDYIFRESSNGIIIVSDKDSSEVCNYSLMHKVVDENNAYFIFYIFEEGNSYVGGISYGFYGNFTTEFLNILQNTNRYYLEDFFNNYVEDIPQDTGHVYGYRNIENVSEANDEYNYVFRVENGSWVYYYRSNNKSYYEFEKYWSSQGKAAIAVIYENLTLDVSAYNERINKPINLTQIKNIENIEINGSGGYYANYLYLDDYFENLGYNDYNLSFRYAINNIIPANVISFDYDHHVHFDTSNILGGKFTMNITLSHPEWNNEENVTSNNFNVTINGCLDSDGGSYDYYNKGLVRNMSENKTDYCVDNSKVMEYYCSYQNIRNYSLSCGSGYYCSDGRCVVNVSVEHPPRFLDVCEDLVWEMNKSYILNMKTCWVDDDGDNLQGFRYSNGSNGNLSISQNNTNLTLTPVINWNGTGYFYIYANDSKNETQGRVNFKVYKIVNLTIIITTNQTNITANNTPNIKSYSPGSEKVNISYNGSKEFSVVVENYDNIRWYVDGVLVKSDVGAYKAEGLSEGEHEIKVEVKKGGNIVSKIWSLNVSGEEETPKKDFLIYLVIIFVVVGILILVVVFLIVKNIMEKKWDENVPEIKELKPGTREGYVPPSRPINYFEG